MRLRPVDNPPNPYLSEHVEWLEPPPPAKIEVYEEVSGSILSENDSPDLPFRWSVNPYRGCQHGCAYCYARPYHEYLGLGAGTDFETKLIVKKNAPELLAEAFSAKTWQREPVNFSGITDCYQPLEASYGLTRSCLQVCLDFRNPAMVVTKSFLVVRDAELLARLNEAVGARIFVSIPFADGAIAKLIEPQAPPPGRRFEAIRRMREAGVPVGVLVAPIIPGLTDQDVPEILRQAAEAGARSAGYTALRLPGNVEHVFLSRLREQLPLRAEKIIHRIREIRGGRLNDSRFGARMRGEGAYWESIRNLFSVFRHRYGLGDPKGINVTAATKPSDAQLNLAFGPSCP
jgi:DNA repair photolyase